MKIIFSENESKLVKLCKNGDAKAQFKLYKLYSKGMYNVATRMTNDRVTAEDILQDAFITAFSGLKKLKNEKAFGGWLKRIVINRCIDETRKKRIIFTDMEMISGRHLEIAEEVDDSLDPELVHSYIKKLPEGARQILVMRALEGYKHAEIAEQLGISESTAKTQFFRAKQLIVKMIKETGDERESGKVFKGESFKA
ncbi:MAG: sigma-70 family RNA polymerase sigma factor [Bacteroidetes bacterium]|nr:sigma-70 family RNA polymerase sigma factor [Bacteroidota bacterium]